MTVLADVTDNERWRVAALEARAYLHMVGSGISQARAPLAEAAARAHAAGDESAHRRLTIRLANVNIRLGNTAEALELLRRRRAALEPAGTPAEWIDLLNAEVNGAFVVEDVDVGARAGAELLELARRVGDVESENRAHNVLAYVANIRGNAADMRHHSDLALAAFERTGRGRLLSVALVNRGSAEMELGRIAEALRFWERAATAGAAAGARDVVMTTLVARAEAELLREHFADAAEIAAEALAFVRAEGDERIVAESLVMSGAARCAIGNMGEGLPNLYEGVARHRAANGKRSLPQALTYLVEALVRAGELAKAAEAATELQMLDVASAPFPEKIHLTLSTFHGAVRDANAARASLDEGRRILRARLAALSPDDAKAYQALPFSRALLRPAALTRR